MAAPRGDGGQQPLVGVENRQVGGNREGLDAMAGGKLGGRASSRSTRRALRARSQPRAAKARAKASPMPEEAPVTRASGRTKPEASEGSVIVPRARRDAVTIAIGPERKRPPGAIRGAFRRFGLSAYSAAALAAPAPNLAFSSPAA